MSAPEPHVRYDDPPPRFRWVPPLMIGLTLGAIAGMLVTFAVRSATTKSEAVLLARQLDIQRVVAAAAPQGELRVSTDATTPVGRRAVSADTADAVRRRVVLHGNVTPDRADALRQAFEAVLRVEIGRMGGFQSGSGSSVSSGSNSYHATEEVTYYTRDHREGHVDVVFHAHEGRVNVTVVLTEAR